MNTRVEGNPNERLARHQPRTGPLTNTETLLYALGSDPRLVDAILGDLEEEYTSRCERHGAQRARLWYSRELLRSAPHLLRDAIRHASPRARLQLAGCAAATALALTLGVLALARRDGPPVRLIADVGAVEGAVVVNNMRPVQLEMRVLDARGHALTSRSVRYRWASGAPIAVSSTGVIRCKHDGDATVRASLGSIVTNVDVWCRPVDQVRASSWIDFVVGDPPRHLPFVAIGPDGQTVTQLRGAARVYDSTVATLVGTSLRPRAIGSTSVEVDVGDQRGRMQVNVHELVSSFDRLRPDQRYAAMRVHLAHGDTVAWSLPKGVFWLKYLPRRPGESPPAITVDGDAWCAPTDGFRVYEIMLDEYGKYCHAGSGSARVIIGHGNTGALNVDGALAVERVPP
ncbi:MAG: hypothetical protein ABJE10_04775 [bacterium]